MLVDLKSSVWVAIALLPDFGQRSAESIAAEYETAVDDLPRSLLHEVLNGKYKYVSPPGALPFPEPTKMANIEGVGIPAILDRHLLFLHNLVGEFRRVSAVIGDVLLGLDWTNWRRTQSTADVDPFYFVGITQPSQPLTPMDVQLLRSMVRMRTAGLDWQRASSDFEQVLELTGQVVRGQRAPAVQMSQVDLRELEVQKEAWKSAFLEISLDWFGLLRGAASNDFVFWDRKHRQEVRKSRVTGQKDLISSFNGLNMG